MRDPANCPEGARLAPENESLGNDFHANQPSPGPRVASGQLVISGVSVAYGGVPIVSGVDLSLVRGDIGCLLGPSGCGKTTLLRAVAGFEPVASGEIHLHGRQVAGPGLNLPPEARRAGMVFQDFALFPHLTVARNVSFGLRHLNRRERQTRVAELLELIGMAGAGDKYPHQLSGGQQQRIALARAMAPRPDILLLDEPFSSMDANCGSSSPGRCERS